MATSAATRLLASTRTVELDGDWTRVEIADVLKRLEFAPCGAAASGDRSRCARSHRARSRSLDRAGPARWLAFDGP